MRTPVSRETLFPALCAGIAASLVFLVSTGLDELNAVLLLFCSGFPLLLIGLASGLRLAGIACITALLATLMVAGPAHAVFFTGFILLPYLYFLRQSLFWRGPDKAREWYPMLTVIADITLVVALGLMLTAISMESQGGLHALAPHSVPVNIKDADPDLFLTLQRFSDEWSFTLFSFAGTLWVLAIYGLSILANRILAARKAALRPSLAIGTEGLPAGLLMLLAISGGMILGGKGAYIYNAQAVFVLLLLPYLVCGFAMVHRWSIAYQIRMRSLWIACFYIASLRFGWPLLALIAAGLYCQLTEMLDRHKKMG